MVPVMKIFSEIKCISHKSLIDGTLSQVNQFKPKDTSCQYTHVSTAGCFP